MSSWGWLARGKKRSSHLGDGEGGAPLLLEDVKADGAVAVHCSNAAF